MTEAERRVFEELLSASTRAVRKLGVVLPIGETMALAQRYTRAANAAEKILDPLRSAEERFHAEEDLQ